MISQQGKYDSSIYWTFGLFLGLGIIWFFPWRFQTNDDVMMMWLVSGAYTGEPEPYAVFIHPWLSWTFSKLYSGSPEVNWYGLTWFGVNFLSAFLLLKKIWTTTFPTIQKHLLSLFIGLISVHFAFFPQFTLIAGFAVLGGMTQLFSSYSRRGLALGFFTFFLGFSIRLESAALISLGWIWAAFIFPLASGNLKWFKILGLLILCLFLGLGKWGYESAFISEEYLKFNSARATVLDHPVFVQQSQKGEIPESSDWFYVSRWMFEELPLDKEDFLIKKKELDQSLFQWKAMGEGLTRLVRIQRTELFKSMLIGFLLLAFFASGAGLKKKILFLSIWIGFYLIFNHFNLLLGRVNLLFFLVLLFPVFYLPKPTIPRQAAHGLFLFLLLFLCFHSFNFYKEAQGRLAFQREFDRLLAEKNPESPLFLEGVFEYLFTEQYNSIKQVSFLGYGWISRSAMQEKAYGKREFSSQREMEDFYLLVFRSAEPVIFPDYMNRISPGFQLSKQINGESLVLLHFSKPKNLFQSP
ncbi:hypothetical protein [Algoriphagus confluentis]|uniref:Glycosyltransferase RgtA/B/C/D-like domain-containing protein n=1 Tax=Algoriphagus confluentis TaxID=1697556 RepID=A0ABQ6PQL9_9BACT|nr:hypothetical protein Aconfl_21930 [Algoriphagus confluentis]